VIDPSSEEEEKVEQGMPKPKGLRKLEAPRAPSKRLAPPPGSRPKPQPVKEEEPLEEERTQPKSTIEDLLDL